MLFQLPTYGEVFYSFLPVVEDADVFGELDALVAVLGGLIGASYGGGSCAMDPVEWSYA